MKRSMLIIAIAVLLLQSADVKAASLFGKVIEVNSGDVITIFNLNRPVRVRLLGVDAPEMDQAFGDVAKKHLSDLVYDKSVLVEYSGISADSSLEGRVLLNNTDVGAQMIRDGAAWFNPNNLNRLSTADREVYQQSEQAARSERRGLWQAENPTAPWEFVKAQSLRRDPVASLNSILPAAKAGGNRPVPELTNLTLMTAGMAPASGSRGATTSPNDSDPGWSSAVPNHGNWRQLRPDGENFSALVPEAGKVTMIPLPAGDRMVESHVYLGRDGWSIFGVMWVTAPTYGETDKTAISVTLKGFLKGVGQGYQSRSESLGRSESFSCELPNEKSISMNGFTGSEFDLKNCTVPARARVFTRVVDGQRQMYLGVVFYGEEDESVTRFLKSFTVVPGQKTKPQRH